MLFNLKYINRPWFEIKDQRSHGRFLRSFSPPGGVDPETIKAEYIDDVLKVEIPKPQKSQPP